MKTFNRSKATIIKLACLFLILTLLIGNVVPGPVTAVDITTTDETIVTNEGNVDENATQEVDFSDNTVLVVLTNEASLSGKVYTVSDFPEVACSSVVNLTETSTSLAQAKKEGKDAASVCSVDSSAESFSYLYDVDLSNFNAILRLDLSEPGKKNVLTAVDLLEKRTDVKYAGPDYIATMESTSTNDPYRSLQWGIDKIELPRAWDYGRGSTSIKIGVLDSGIDADHPDLAGRIDIEMSRDFTSGTPTSSIEVYDVDGHGTHVAGIIAASTNNLVGVSGAAWYCTLVSLRVFNAAGTTGVSRFVLAVEYATSQGIPILNFSGSWAGYSQAAYEAIENYQGLLVCAAGNGNGDDDTIIGSLGIDITLYGRYPASYDLPNIISVGATDANDNRPAWSNYGPYTVDVFAPGVNILSTFSIDKCETGFCEKQNCIHYENGYHYASGTSMATPFVTGVAALILSRHPNYSPEQIIAEINESVDVVSSLSNLCITGGRLNAYDAVTIG